MWKEIDKMKRGKDRKRERDICCGSIGRSVASDTRDLRLEYRHRQISITIYVMLSVLKIQKKKKEAGYVLLLMGKKKKSQTEIYTG